MTTLSARVRRTLTVLALVAIVARIAFGIVTWEPGWSALTWDDFTRVAIANEWAQAPFWFNGLVWLPLPVWITGSVFAVFGGFFESSPMALMAVINTAAVFVAAVVAGWSAHRIFNDQIGTLHRLRGCVVRAVDVLLVALRPRRTPLLRCGHGRGRRSRRRGRSPASTCRSASGASGSPPPPPCGTRAGGWQLRGSAVIGIDTLLLLQADVRSAVSCEIGGATLAIAAAPLLVPLAWLGVNLVQEDSPFYFARESGRIFKAAYGGFDSRIGRIFYYPMSLLRSAPLLLVLEGVVAVVRIRRRAVVLIVGLFATQFVLFYVTSLPFAGPGCVPGAIPLRLRPRVGSAHRWPPRGAPRPGAGSASSRPAAIALIVGAVAVTVVRIQDRPEEWTHAPDLLALNEQNRHRCGRAICSRWWPVRKRRQITFHSPSRTAPSWR